MKRVVVLISGRGSNLGALLDAAIPVIAVVSNVPEAGGLDIARRHGVDTGVVDHRTFPDRAAFDDALAAAIDRHRPDLLVLAGFMRILGNAFVAHYAGRMINIHPSLLPAFTGLNTHRRALDAGVRIHGCTVHFVTAELDHGPIIAQAAVPVLPDDDEPTLAARVLEQEHQLLPAAVRWFVDSRMHLDGRHVRIDPQASPACALLAPTPA